MKTTTNGPYEEEKKLCLHNSNLIKFSLFILFPMHSTKPNLLNLKGFWYKEQ